MADAGAACVTVVADRECDIYEEFALRPQATELLIRCHHNRLLAADGRLLFACTESLAELGRVLVHVPPAPRRVECGATVALYARRVTLRRPKRNRAAETAKLPPEQTLTYVEVREVDKPARGKPLLWCLLTTHTVTTLLEAQRMVDLYRRRWSIEQVFRLMKTDGFDIEAVEAVCATLEGPTAKQKNPHPRGSLACAAWVCARLGGWTGYYGKPGPIVIHHGIQRLNAMLAGWRIASSL